MKFTKEARKKGQEARRPKLVYDCPEYSIKEIPLNYEITAKVIGKNKKRLIGESFYCDLERGLETAKALAESTIRDYLSDQI